MLLAALCQLLVDFIWRRLIFNFRDIATKPSYLHIRKWRDEFVFGPWIDDRGPARGAEKAVWSLYVLNMA
jgi:hypothetical protein